MIRNGKYFIAPPGDDVDFKVLFQNLATAGAGRPVDRDGVPQGSWTPDLLADAISEIDANRTGIDLRTVQLWFQENDRGISTDNIRWLARIFGCDDPKATSDWQAKLSASQARLAARRRGKRKPNVTAGTIPESGRAVAASADALSGGHEPRSHDEGTSPKRFSLARRTEALFVQGSPLNLPAVIFAGAFALQLGSYFLGIHSVVHVRDDGIAKQVGFLWAPNWAFVLILLIPLFLGFVAHVLGFWKNEGRRSVLGAAGQDGTPDGWTRNVEGASYTYWAAFAICIGFAGLVQWVDVRLLPLLTGESDYAIDWGRLPITRSDAASVVPSVAFTAFAYGYMSVCFYLFYSGLILLYTVQHDLWKIRNRAARPRRAGAIAEGRDTELRVIAAVFRCTMIGLLIAICIKLQTLYLLTSASNVLRWLIGDARSVLVGPPLDIEWTEHSAPTHYTSLVIALVVVVVFLDGIARLALADGLRVPSMMAVAAVVVLAAYLLIGMVNGFSILLGLGLLVAVYGIIDPEFGTRRADVTKDDRIVP